MKTAMIGEGDTGGIVYIVCLSASNRPVLRYEVRNSTR